MAHAAAVEDQPVGEHRPVPAGEQGAHGVLDLHRVGLVREPQAPGEPAEVRVHGDPGPAEGVAEHHERGLAPHPGQRHEVLETGGDLAVVPGHELLGQPQDRGGLVPVEPRGAHELLQLGFGGRGHRVGVREAGEQRRRGRVDPHVGGLGGQHRGHEQLERRLEVQLGDGVRVRLGQDPVDPPRPAHQGQPGLPGRRARRLRLHPRVLPPSCDPLRSDHPRERGACRRPHRVRPRLPGTMRHTGPEDLWRRRRARHAEAGD
ncbi:hypothetical protein BW35_00852 [Micrococcus luteus]|nr:hypothetical protein BW35_00852 [Micrococcus luteus]